MNAAVQTAEGTAASHPLDLLRERVQLRTRRRIAWLRHLDTTANGDILLRDVLDTSADESTFYAASGPLQALALQLHSVEARLAAGPEAEAFRRLSDVFDLAPGELDVLSACLALELAPALGPAFAFLGGTAPCVTEPLVRRLFGHDVTARVLPPAGPLLAWQLVTAAEAGPGEPPPLRCDPQLRTWLSGQSTIHPRIAAHVRPIAMQRPLPSWPVDPTAAALADHLRAGVPVRLVVAGPPGSGRRSFAAVVLDLLGFPAFAVLSSRVDEPTWAEHLLLATRDALAVGAAPVWEHVEGRPPLRRLAALASQAIVCAADERPAPIDGVLDLRVALPTPDIAERTHLWRAHLPAARTWPEGQLSELAARFPLIPGELAAIAVHRPATALEAADRCREATRHRLGELGQRLRGGFGWDDLVLSAKLHQRLADLAFEARDRAGFWELPQARRLYPRGTGLVALFTGPAGTGKTMAAQVLAAELGLDVVRIDLAATISKYIGETAKHLRRIFVTAAGTGAVLLFDEADALFARRTDVRDSHDRHANTDTNYLLQLVEDFSGVAILASNKKTNLDPAFTRRIRHILDFPRPDAAARRQIWRQILAELGSPLADLTLDSLAALDLSGAQIKNAILAALFVSRSETRPLAVPHVIRGLERELEKDGRSLDLRERERLASHG